MKTDNRIFGMNFKRSKRNCHKVVLLLENEIPAIGYSCKELRKMLKEYDNAYVKATKDFTKSTNNKY